VSLSSLSATDFQQETNQLMENMYFSWILFPMIAIWSWKPCL